MKSFNGHKQRSTMKNNNILSGLKTMMILALVAGQSVFLSGCMKTIAATEMTLSSKVEVTEAMLKLVNNEMRRKIPGGEWRYQGAQGINGTINAYIQIPKKLKMTQAEQKNYLKYALCPSSANKQMWTEIKEVPLSVHVYIDNKKHTVFAYCDNPVA